MRHLLHHPEVRTEIKQLKFRSVLTEYASIRTWESWDAPMTTFRPPSTPGPTPNLSREEKDRLIREVSESVAGSESLVRQIEAGVPDALCSVLLLWATKLEYFDLAIPITHGEELAMLAFINQACRMNMLTYQPFQKLETVSLASGNKGEYADGRHIAPFLSLPRLRTLRLAWLSLENLTQPQGLASSVSKFPQGTSPLENIIIKRSRITCTSLEILLAACYQLNRLDLTWHRGLGRQFRPQKELLDILPKTLVSLKVSDPEAEIKSGEWLTFCDDLLDKSNSNCTSLKDVNLWDVPMNMQFYSKESWDSLIERGENDGLGFLLRRELKFTTYFLKDLSLRVLIGTEPKCDSLYKVHVAKNCRCYWTLEQQRKFENRKRRGQI